MKPVDYLPGARRDYDQLSITWRSALSAARNPTNHSPANSSSASPPISTADLHRRATLAATLAGKSFNAWVAQQLQAAVKTDNSTVAGRLAKNSTSRAKR